MPTDEERKEIDNIDTERSSVPLTKAEEFIYTLASIPELESRLKLLKLCCNFREIAEVHTGMAVFIVNVVGVTPHIFIGSDPLAT
jgi:hypothetical protein